jgi:hypothetical protein
MIKCDILYLIIYITMLYGVIVTILWTVQLVFASFYLKKIPTTCKVTHKYPSEHTWYCYNNLCLWGNSWVPLFPLLHTISYYVFCHGLMDHPQYAAVSTYMYVFMYIYICTFENKTESAFEMPNLHKELLQNGHKSIRSGPVIAVCAPYLSKTSSKHLHLLSIAFLSIGHMYLA